MGWWGIPTVPEGLMPVRMGVEIEEVDIGVGDIGRLIEG